MLEIVVHPARVRPLASAVVLAYLGLASWGLAHLSASALGLTVPGCAAALAGVFAVLMRRWFVPTRYRFDDDGIEVGGWPPRRWRWRRFRSWRKERGGYFLSPFTNPRRFDHFRGLFMPLEYVIHLSPAPPPATAVTGDIASRTDAHAAITACLKEKIDGRIADPA